MAQSTNVIEILIGTTVSSGGNYHPARTGGPSNQPSQDTIDRLNLSYNMLSNNYIRLMDAVDGHISTNAIVVVDQAEDEDDVRRELYTRVHNYVSSLYSYITQARDFINNQTNSNQRVENRDISPHHEDKAPCKFVEKLAYPLGIRHGFQHGDYQFLDFDKIDVHHGFAFHELRFLVAQFNDSSVDYPQAYTQYVSRTGVPSHSYPISYMYSFHRNSVSDFHSDLIDWANGNP